MTDIRHNDATYSVTAVIDNQGCQVVAAKGLHGAKEESGVMYCISGGFMRWLEGL